MIARAQLVDTLRQALEASSRVNAAWLGGSDATGSADEASDIDLFADVADGCAAEVFEAIEAALQQVGAIGTLWVVPEPAWHGHRQRFYQLRDAPETLLVDAVLMERGSPADRFDAREQHGEPVVLFDRIGVARARPLDRPAHEARLRQRRGQLVAREALFGGFAEKEARRGRPLDARWAYQAFLIAPLVEALRMRYCPERFHFGERYTDRDLPPAPLRRLVELAYVRDLDDLIAKAPLARAWLRQELQD